jgi:hypothetical protein
VYKAPAPALTDLVGGRVQMQITTYGFLKQYIDNWHAAHAGLARGDAQPVSCRTSRPSAELGYPGPRRTDVDGLHGATRGRPRP